MVKNGLFFRYIYIVFVLKISMNKKERWIIYSGFILVYLIFLCFNISVTSQWWIDNVMTIAILTLVILIIEKLEFGRVEFWLFNLAFLVHNLGTFGFYEFQWGIIAYDNLTHLFGSIVAAYIVFNFVSKRLKLKLKLKKSFTGEYKVILLFLVIASVAMLGVGVELMEFFGYNYLGLGDGILFVGSGDSTSGNAGQYLDTMGDIIMNTIGSFIGAFIYLGVKKKSFLNRAGALF